MADENLTHATRFPRNAFRVRYAETDQMGVVYYANYLIWMEVGRADYCRTSGIRYRDMEQNDGILLAVVEAHCRYLCPARYDEEIAVKTWIGNANRRMVEFQYEICERADGPRVRRRIDETRFRGPGHAAGETARKILAAVWHRSGR